MSYPRLAQRAARTAIRAASVRQSLYTASACVSRSRLSSVSHSSSFHSASRQLQAAAPTVVATPGSTIDFNLADIGEGIAECEVLKWFISEGDTIAQFDKVCEVQSDKANVEITSRYDGVVKSLKYKVGELAKVGKPLLSIQIAGTAPTDASAPVAAAAAAAAGVVDVFQPASAIANQLAADAADDELNAANGKVLTSPAVRRIAKEEKVNLAHVRATGPGGRILKEDVLAFIKAGRPAPGVAAAAQAAAPVAAAAAAPAAAPAAPAAHGKHHAQPIAQYLKEDKVIPITYVQGHTR